MTNPHNMPRRHIRAFSVFIALIGSLNGLSIPPVFAANSALEALLRKGSTEWNEMRISAPDERIELTAVSLKGRRLKQVNLSRAGLAGADFSQSELMLADFREADLHGVTFTEAILSGSNLSGTDLSGANFTKASCDKADFTGARMASTILRRADLSRAVLRKSDLGGSDLREACLEYADLRSADLRAANLWLASAGGATFDEAIISDATILPDGKNGSSAWATAHGAVFMQASDLSREPLRNPATDTSSDSADSAVRNAPVIHHKPVRAWRPQTPALRYDVDQFELLRSDVTKWNDRRSGNAGMVVNLREAPLSGKMLAGADLHGAVLAEAHLKRADLGKANLSGADLRGVDFRSANLERCDLRRADLRGANLWLANTSRTNFDGAIISPDTVLDNGKGATKAWAEKHAAQFTEEVVPKK